MPVPGKCENARDMDERAGKLAGNAEAHGGLSLLGVNRFRPFFLTQFLGAFNDNVFRNALIGIIAFQLAGIDARQFGAASWINLAMGLFILPFFLCSAVAGQIADKYDKAGLMRRIKLAEILIMLVGAVAVVSGSVPLLMLAIALTGTQSAFFGPAKYGILPIHLHNTELTAGNALVQAGTMVAILLGTIAGGLLVDIPDIGRRLIAVIIIAVAIMGWLSSRRIPPAPPIGPPISVDFNIVRSTWRTLRHVSASRTILLSVLGVSWFWFVGSVLLAQLPIYVRDELGGGQPVATLLLATFTVGVVAGSLLCERFSGRRVEIGLVPMGALGIAIFAAAFGLSEIPAADVTVTSMLTTWPGLAIVLKLFLLSLSSGLYIVPLYSVVQSRSDPAEVSRVIAFNNVVNALFMVTASVAAILLLQAGFSIPQLILAVTAMHVCVAVFIFFEVPEFAMRLVVWIITHSLYRVRVDGIDHVPDSGPAVLVCNHVSLIDPLVITSACRRPIRFVMYHKIYEIPVLNFLFRVSGAIPIASRREDPELLARAYDEIADTLERGGLVGIFPEGKLTGDGEIGEFKPGIERILERTPVPVVPMALSGLWGTFFTRYGDGKLMSRWPRHWLSLIRLRVGPPVAAEQADIHQLSDVVRSLASR